jgi:hypothetical protein
VGNVTIPEILDSIKRILDLVSPQRHVVKGINTAHQQLSVVIACDQP